MNYIDSLINLHDKNKRTVVYLSTTFGFLIWIIDAILDYSFFYKNEGSFLKILILDPPSHEIYIRSVIVCTFILFGILISSFIVKFEERKEKQHNEQSALLKITQSLIGTMNYEEVLQIISDGMSELLGIETAALYIISEKEKLFLGATTPPLDQNMPESLRSANLDDHPHIKKAVTTRVPQVIQDTNTETLTSAEKEVVEMRKLQSLLFLPFINNKQVLGVLIFGTGSVAKTFSQHDIDLGQTVANQLSFGILNAKLHYEIDLKNKELIDKIKEKSNIEIALRNSESHLSNALRIAKLGQWEIDIQSEQFKFSDEFYELMRTNAEEAGGYFMDSKKYAEKFVHPDDVHLVGEEIKRAIESEEKDFSAEAEHRIKYADGNTGYVLVRYKVIKDDEGRTIKAFGVNQDITERKLQDVKFKESEKKFRSLFNNLNAALALHEMVWDDYGNPIDFIFLDVNPMYENLTKLKKDNILGKKGKDIITGLEQKWIDIYGEVVKTGKSRSIIDHSEYLDKFWEVLVFSPGENQFAVILNDITERKKTEDALKENERRYSEAETVADMGYYVYDIRSGFFTSSPGLDRIWGMDDDFVRSVENWAALIYPDDLQMMVDHLQNHVLANHNRFDKRYRIIDQTTKEIKWVHGLGNLNYDEENNPIEMFGTVQDITKLIQIEQKLIDNEEKLNTLFEAMTEMVVLHEVVLDDKGEPVDYKIIDCNKTFTEVTGLKKEATIGKLATELYQSSKAPYLEEYSKVALTGQDYQFTTYYQPMDKHFMISAVSPKKGQFATITTDITSIKQIEEVIKSKNKELENYLYVASHDLRSPLVNIQGFSKRLEEMISKIKKVMDDQVSDKVIKEQLEKMFNTDIPRTLDFIYNGVIKMDSLINGLLRISRTGRVAMTITKINMNDLVKSVVDSQNYQIEDAQAEIVLGDLPECYGDRDLINQLFSNIIGNSIKYRDKKRKLELTISGSLRYKHVLYLVRDNGMGIAKRHIDRIWDVFFQIHPQTNSSGEGIGLSIVKRIIDKHKGKISVESEEGKGTTFFIELQNTEFSE